MGQPHSTPAGSCVCPGSLRLSSGEGSSAGATDGSERINPGGSPLHIVGGGTSTTPARHPGGTTPLRPFGGETPARRPGGTIPVPPFGEGTSASAAQRSTGAAPAPSTPRRLFRRALSARRIKAVFTGQQKGKGRFEDIYELGKEVGVGFYGRTYEATVKKGDMKGQTVAVKIIPKDKLSPEAGMTIEDVCREVKLLKALSGHTNFVKYYDAFEDNVNFYIIMQLCEGGELRDRIISRGERYTEEDAKVVVVQILNAVAFCHLQGVVHRDIKPENVLYTTRDETATMKIIDFGLATYIRPDERLTFSVGTTSFAAPEVLNRSYSTKADIWSIGVITYILLYGDYPFLGETDQEIIRAVKETKPNFTNPPWPSVSTEAKDFVERLMIKDYRKRMTAVQALTHPWLLDERRQVPLDILIYKLVKSYLLATPLKRAALKALSKALPEDELVYTRSQFQLLIPDEEGCVSFENFYTALMRNATEAMEESGVLHIFNELKRLLSDAKMDFQEFCAATISPHQLQALKEWKTIVHDAFVFFEGEGNRAVSVNELAQEMNIDPGEFYFGRWFKANGSLNFIGYTKYLNGLGYTPGLV